MHDHPSTSTACAPGRSSHPAAPGARQFTLNLTLICLLAAFTPLRAAHAQTPSAALAASTLQVDIPAGPLTTVLNQYAQAVDVSLSFDASLLAGKESAGLQGSFEVEAGFRRILQGSGFEAVARAPGRYMLRGLPKAAGEDATDVTQLNAVTVSGYREGDAPNRGYTVSSTSSATKLDLAPKETPQSITTFTAQQIQDQGLLTVSEVLDQTPGITLISAGVAGAGNQPVYSRTFPVTSVQMDGVMASSYILSGSANGNIGLQDSFLYERIDVIRGSNSLTGGEGDASASLNFVRKYPYLDRHLSANLKYGSWNNRRAELDLSTPVNDRFRVRLAAAMQKGNHWVERVKSDRGAVSLIGQLDVTENNRISAGVTQFDFKLDGASPHGLARYSEVSNNRFRPGEKEFLPEGIRDLPPGDSVLPTRGVSRGFNNATPWSHTHRNYTNLFLTWDHDFNDDWSFKASYNHASNMDDQLYGEMGSRYYVPQAGLASYVAKRDHQENIVNAVDVHLKGRIEAFGRDQEFVVGANAYNVNHMVYGGYDSFGTAEYPLLAFESCGRRNRSCLPPRSPMDRTSIGAIPIEGWTARLPEESELAGSRRDMYSARERYITKRRQTGYYFSSHLRPISRVHLILGGRWAKDVETDHVDTDCLVDHCNSTHFLPNSTNPTMRPKFLPYGGLIVELTPQINAYGSYTTSYVRDPVYNGSNGGTNAITGDYLPPVRSITEEGGLKGAFFDERLNIAASYFRMTQKDFPFQSYDPNAPTTDNNGWRVYGWEFNATGAITKDWNIAVGYVKQKQVLPPFKGEIMFSAVDDLTGSYRAPEQSFKLFTTYRVKRLTIGAGVRWQSRTQSAWIPMDLERRKQDYLMRQDAYYVVDLMARYQIDRHFSMQLNVNNIFDKVYYQHERSFNSAPPRNALLTLSYRL
ncbi:TonB-dependent receptor [Achromobacter sp. HNDS-1]|jgi:outer-membrane receptor for ferric coprogen and ferric-rhodotorulic acid|uniref:TonB-dependent receptor n=1 Tax=Achromobacter sp. HNDS-1 TaxID=3151598 RepID=A0AAU7L8J4_9BURK|nr:TonB-dependent receptor [Achromobacter ruhlandii]MCI1837581.1 TonB-dependent receptor [Achromobacter ruhlandii]